MLKHTYTHDSGSSSGSVSSRDSDSIERDRSQAKDKHTNTKPMCDVFRYAPRSVRECVCGSFAEILMSVSGIRNERSRKNGVNSYLRCCIKSKSFEAQNNSTQICCMQKLMKREKLNQ